MSRNAVDAGLLHIILRHHVAAEEGEPLRRRRRGRIEAHHRLRRRDDLDVGDLAPGVRDVDLVAGLDPLEEGVAEIRRRHLVAVVKDDVVAKLDRQAPAIGGELPGFHHVRDKLELRVLIERLVEDHLEDRLRVRDEALVRVPARHVLRPTDGDAVGLGGKRLDAARERASAAEAERGRAEQGPTAVSAKAVLMEKPRQRANCFKLKVTSSRGATGWDRSPGSGGRQGPGRRGKPLRSSSGSAHALAEAFLQPAGEGTFLLSLRISAISPPVLARISTITTSAEITMSHSPYFAT